MILGFIGEALQHQKERLFEGYEGLGNILWVNTKKEILINREQPEEDKEEMPDDLEQPPTTKEEPPGE